MSSETNTFPNSLATLTGSQTLSNKALGSNLDANSNKVINLAVPTNDQDAATKKYVDDSFTTMNAMTLNGNQTVTGIKTFEATPVISQITNTGLLTLPTSTDTLVGRATSDTLTNKDLTSDTNTFPSKFATLTGSETFINKTITSSSLGSNLDANSNRIINLEDPTNDSDAVTKNYVDAFISGLQAKKAVRVATTQQLPSYTFNSNTITASSNSALVIDDISLDTSDRVLVKDEINTNAPYNGIYTVSDPGNASSPFILTRGLQIQTEILKLKSVQGFTALLTKER